MVSTTIIMNKIQTIILLAGVIFVLAAFFAFKNSKENPSMSHPNNDDYSKEWQKINDLEQQGLPKSALKEVKLLFERAKKEDNKPQIVKTLLYREKYNYQLEEDGQIKAIQALNKEIETAEAPVKQILQSIVAQFYQNYFQNNYWMFRDRTDTDDWIPDDISTWSLKKLIGETTRLYLASLEEDELGKIDVIDYKAITNFPDKEVESDELRPHLSDLLAHRALQYLKSDISYINQPELYYRIEDEAAFSFASNFTAHEFKTKQTNSKQYAALRIYQQLLKSHLNDKDPKALIDLDLDRLYYVYNKSPLENKNELFLNALNNLIKKYNNHPSVTDVYSAIANHYRSRADEYNPDTKPQYKDHYLKALEAIEEANKKFPDSKGAVSCRNMKKRIQQPSLSMNLEEINVSGEPFPILVTYKNVKKIYSKAVRIPHEKIDEWRAAEAKDKLSLLAGEASFNNQTIELPDDGNYRSHSTELKIGELAFGHYAILISNNKDFSTTSGNVVIHGETTVSDLAYFHRNNQPVNKNEFHVVNRKNGNPVSEVEIEFYERKYNASLRRNQYNRIGFSKTDKNGYAENPKNVNKNYRIKLIKGKDILYIQRDFYNYNYNNSKNTSYYTHLFLDRGIYRPGQTVYFKGLSIMRNSDDMPQVAAGKKVKIIFQDVNGQKIKTLDLTTNEYGTINGTFQAPSSGLLGRMSIIAELEGQRSSKSLKVEEYKRPKFDVDFKPVQGTYKLNDEIEVTGIARAFAGNNIDGAKVTYRVVREARYPYWCWWWRPAPKSPAKEIARGNIVTDEKGEFIIKFKAVPDKSVDPKTNPEFQYKVYADVTDITGETRNGTQRVNVGTISMRVSVETPSIIQAEKIEQFKITAVNLNNEKVDAKGIITIHKLKPNGFFINRLWTSPDKFVLSEKEFKSAFPNRAYKDEDQVRNWTIEKEYFNGNFDTGKSDDLDLSKIKWTAGKYKLVLKSVDKYGEEIQAEHLFSVMESKGNELPTPSSLFVHQNQTKYEPGENAEINIGSFHKNQKILFETEHKSTIIKREWLTLKELKNIRIPIEEKHRGGMHYHVSMVHANRPHLIRKTIFVPWSNKELNIEYGTFRDKLLPGQEEEWKIKISGPKGEKVTAEMVAGMYDASLDEFAANNWNLSLFPGDRMALSLNAYQFNNNYGQSFPYNWNRYEREKADYKQYEYRQLNLFGFPISGRMGMSVGNLDYSRGGFTESPVSSQPITAASAPPAPEAMEGAVEDAAVMSNGGGMMEEKEAVKRMDTNDHDEWSAQEDSGKSKSDFSDVKVRTNLNETVFFLPELYTDKNGDVIIKFKMNEALTKWKFLGLAHTKDLKTGITKKEIITQKDLMIMPNPPRFFREGDEIEFTAKVSNISDQDLKGSAVLQLFDAVTNESLDIQLNNKNAEIPFTVKTGLSAPLKWNLKIPKGGLNAITHRVVAKAGDFSDGEEDALPVLTNRMLVTETLPLPVRPNEKKDFVLEKLKNSGQSNSLEHHKMTLEFTSNPAWYAVQALPYLMEYPYDCTEQIFSRYYANSLATTVANNHPKIKSVFDKWKNTESDALVSNLSKNEELKYALLEETPWVLDAQNEEEQKKNIGLLFDLNKMAKEQEKAINKIAERQLTNGGFSWFPGGRDSWYITQYLVEGMGHLDRMGVKSIANDNKVSNMLTQAVKYCDDRLVEYHNKKIKWNKGKELDTEKDHLDNMIIHYLYSRSYFSNISKNKNADNISDFYWKQAEKFWNKKSLYQRGMLALAMHRKGEFSGTTSAIMKSLKEYSLSNEELGMYWKYDTGYFWYQLPIETHSLLIEAFDEVAGDEKSVEEMKIWLLKNKQTTNWKTTKATAAAVYALLMRGDNWLLADKDIKIKIGGKKLNSDDIQKEAGTGYFKTDFTGKKINSDMASISVENPNNVVAWGAAYWQYFEELDKITDFKKTPLTLDKKLFKEVLTSEGPVIKPISEMELNPGDKIKVRIELRVDRDMEYVHMKDGRASGLEPINVISQYKWQGGLGYYESTRDASTNFFFDYLPKGTYVFEYPLRVQHRGDFSNGITTIQCMYAPEFTSHSEGIRINVE